MGNVIFVKVVVGLRWSGAVVAAAAAAAAVALRIELQEKMSSHKWASLFSCFPPSQ
jgi:hypothetical protein